MAAPERVCASASVRMHVSAGTRGTCKLDISLHTVRAHVCLTDEKGWWLSEKPVKQLEDFYLDVTNKEMAAPRQQQIWTGGKVIYLKIWPQC